MMRELPDNVEGKDVFLSLRMLFYRTELQRTKWGRRGVYGFLLLLTVVMGSYCGYVMAEMPYTFPALGYAVLPQYIVAGVLIIWLGVTSERASKRYALNPCCPDCGRDMVDCWREKWFPKCKAMQGG